MACRRTERPQEVVPAGGSHWQPMNTFLSHRNCTSRNHGTAGTREAGGFVNRAVNRLWGGGAKLLFQVWIQDLVKGGPQLLRPKVADVAKRSRASKASILRPGSRAHLRALEAFGFLMLKYAFSHILETLFLLFLTSILTPKVDKNRALDFTSIQSATLCQSDRQCLVKILLVW